MKNYNGIRECLTDNTEVRELIINNPDLPLIFLCGEECWNDECGYLVNIGKASIDELALYEEKLVTQEDLEEKLTNVMSKENKNLTNEEFSKLVSDELSKYEFRKAIVVTLG